jgi:hypothetical protein
MLRKSRCFIECFRAQKNKVDREKEKEESWKEGGRKHCKP